MPVPPDGIVVRRLMSADTPNWGNGNQPLCRWNVPSRAEPVEMHWTLLLLFAACAVTAIQKLPHRLGSAIYQYFPSEHLFQIVAPFTPQHAGSLTGKSLFPPRAARLPASAVCENPMAMAAITDRH